MNKLITIQDLFIVPFLLMVVYFVANRVKNKHIKEEPYYKYFAWGLWAKVFAGLAFAAIYLFYYGGGDTVYYFWGSESIVRMTGKSFPTFLKLVFGNHSAEVYSMFDQTTGYPTYWRDPNSFAVCRFNIPFYVLGFGSYLGNTILMNLFLYFGIWRFYKMLVEFYPKQEKWMAIAVFFIPSVVFWSSGILKDGWTLTGILLLYNVFHQLFIKKVNVAYNTLLLIFWGYIVFSIRPFLLYATLGAGLIWIGFSSIQKVKSKFLRTIVFPITSLIIWILGTILLTQLGQYAGTRYSNIDAMLETAKIIQDDLKKDYYEGNTFDIGEFEPTIPGVLTKVPQAIIAGLFRPFIWEAKSPLMILSGLENLILLLAFILILFKTKIVEFIILQIKNPFLLSLFTLALTLAFSMGITVANFGSLVRYVIPVTILFTIVIISSWFKLKLENKKSKKKKFI